MARPFEHPPARPEPRFVIRRLPLDSWPEGWGERPWKVRDALAPHWIGAAGSFEAALRLCLFTAYTRRREAGERPVDAIGERVAIDIAIREAEREAEARSEARIREKIWREEDAIRRAEAEEERGRMAGVAWSSLTGGLPYVNGGHLP